MDAREIALAIENNAEFAFKNSLENCHAFGVHSIVFENEEGRLKRVFFTEEWHDLWRNEMPNGRPFYDLSVAVHPHHCDVTLTTLKGVFINYEFRFGNNGDSVLWHRYLYRSPIKKGWGRFEYEALQPANLYETTMVHLGDSVEMLGTDMHTVYVPQGMRSAWLVEEGPENPRYVPYCLSNAPLDRFNFNGMYQPMRETTFIDLVGSLL